MARVSKFTDEQKLQIAMYLLGGTLSHAEVCRKYDISATYAYKLKDRALEILREQIGRQASPMRRSSVSRSVWASWSSWPATRRWRSGF